MARSAGLALYLASRALTERGKAKPEQKPGLPLPRPEGEVAWFAVGPGARPGAIVPQGPSSSVEEASAASSRRR